jgi:hypothetical protein
VHRGEELSEEAKAPDVKAAEMSGRFMSLSSICRFEDASVVVSLTHDYEVLHTKKTIALTRIMPAERGDIRGLFPMPSCAVAPRPRA